jgi:uncharacterized protein YraI
MKFPNIARAAGLGTVLVLLTAGVASAAVATASVNVRTGPGTGYRVVDTLRPGEQVAIVDRAGGWCAVDKAGANGWVSCGYLASSVRYRDRFDDGPNISLSFGIGTRPDRPRRPHRGDWWDNDRGHWNGSGGSFGLSFSN